MMVRERFRQESPQRIRISCLKAYVVTLDSKRRRKRLMLLQGNPRPLRPVIQTAILTLQPCLEAVSIFPEVVQQPGKRRFVRAGPVAKVFSRERGNAAQVVLQRVRVAAGVSAVC